MAAASLECVLSLRPSFSAVVSQKKCAVTRQSAILCLPAASRSLKGLGAGFKLEISRARKVTLSGKAGRGPISAVAAPIAPPSSPLEDAGERQRLAEEYGFTQIGEPVPADVTLKKVIDSFPSEVFEINDLKAWKTIAISVASYSLGLFMIAKAPWYLLPLAWAWTGTAITGFFVIGHDCAHKSFSKNKLVEDIIGTIAFLPLIYPYEPWRFKHDKHHAKTNMLVEDTAWHPVMKEQFQNFSPATKTLMELGMGPLRPWASIGHWLLWHFDLSKYRESEKPRVKISLAAVFAFMAIGWPAIIYTTGIAGWLKFWLMPWLGYHFWMSTFTMVHHTAPHIPFKNKEDWNSAAAQLGGTVHCDYPKWVEVLCHDISVHIPHHISQKIPSYNLRLAHESLVENWGKHLNIAKFNWRLMKVIMTECHYYDPEKNYTSFDNGEDKSPVIGTLRKVMPDMA
ncbi:omega-6 fatty acid desaturase, chloroplastic [Physcomitrium patens]|uniref:Fatty acid desaturase domain-containing protein n=1 Tax=Physcomitrium patens TaxID=3218 RepID=A0A2K1JPF2_PHYPA|nr:omega-6 fatty acid desaturase, chloroplastic-like [Physcomitrium patens]XP_024390436.1 omega-6 fatty acid desaturase, chloroplastic-like [Physcomitrium patens]PNR43435.1 hypothetical protein PHYPA_015816 [Physcomitrium patens]|eukprot:XP_024390435.1 omega-6 fatty acid desaturase, chloroplastic-like [Physcomitrella patens]